MTHDNDLSQIISEQFLTKNWNALLSFTHRIMANMHSLKIAKYSPSEGCTLARICGCRKATVLGADGARKALSL